MAEGYSHNYETITETGWKEKRSQKERLAQQFNRIHVPYEES